MIRAAFVAAAAMCFAGPAAAQAAPPASAFGRLPETAQAAISPRGDRIALLGGTPEQRRLDVAPIDGGPPVSTPLGSVQVRGVRWAGDGYVLLRAARYDYIPAIRRGVTLERTIAVDSRGTPVSRLLSNSDMSQYTTALPIIMTSGEPRPTAWVLGSDFGRTIARRRQGCRATTTQR